MDDELSGQLCNEREEAVGVEQARYRDLLEFLPGPYLTTDLGGIVREANRAAATLLEVAPRFLVGKPLAAYVADEDRWALRAWLERLGREPGERVANWPLRLRARSGRVAPALATVAAYLDQSGCAAGFRWLFEERRAAGDGQPPGGPAPSPPGVAGVRERQRHVAVAAEAAGAVQRVLDAGLRLLEVDGAALMLLHEREVLRQLAATDEPSETFGRAQEHLWEGPCHDALSGTVVDSVDLGHDERWPRLAEAATVNRVLAVLAAPVCLYGGPIGACMVTCATPRAWNVVDIEAIGAFSGVVATVLELLERDLKRSLG
jgi:PAS domain S-box-containing protein